MIGADGREMVVPPEHRVLIDRLLAETRANGGLAPLDVERFWADQLRAHDDPFHAVQVPLGSALTRMYWETIFKELGLPDDYRRVFEDEDFHADIARRYNDKSERLVGRRLQPGEKAPHPALRHHLLRALNWFPLAKVFGAEYVWSGGDSGSWWLMEAAHSEDELARLLECERAPDGGLWTGPKVARLLGSWLGRRVNDQQAWRVMVRLGFAPKRPRPRHPEADPQAQEAFKGGAWRGP